MQCPRLPLLLFTLLLVAATCLAQMPPGSGSRPALTQAEQEQLDQGVHVVEDKLGLTRGDLRPAFRYSNDQHQAITQHLSRPTSRFAVLHSNEYENYAFMISPWQATHPGEVQPRRGILAFTVYKNGVVEPAFHASVREDAKVQDGENFWLNMERTANVKQEELFSSFRPAIVRTLTPRF